MEELQMKKVTVIINVLLLLSISLVFAGGGQQKGSASTSGSGDLRYQGSITMYAQAYSPDTPTATRPNPPTKFREVAAQWQALHPGITINFIANLEAGQDYMTWIKTRLAGGAAPDIFWAQYYDLYMGGIPAGSFYQLNQYLERPNKYIPGNSRWLDTFQKALITQTSGINGEINYINADYVGTMVVYNVAMFKRAGIDFQIRTWSDYTRACQMLKAAGITPWAWAFGNAGEAAEYFTFFTRLYATNMYYNDFEKLAVRGGKNALSLSPVEVSIAIKNGYFSPSDPRFIGFWANIKDHIDNYMPRDSVSPAINNQTILNMFINQQIAMNWNGSWVNNDLKAANVSFEYSSFPMPIPDTASFSQATNFDSSPAIGGPSAAWQYAISTPLANNTMNSDKLEAVLDWLMFITTPENNSAIVNDLGAFIPTIIGAKPLPANAELVRMLEAEPKVIDIGPLSLGTEAMQAFYREFQDYALGNQTLEQAGRKIMEVFDRTADDVISKADFDVTPYLNKR